jgi:hypothetical protein
MKPRASREEIDAAMRVLLTHDQLDCISDMTAVGYSKLQAVRRLVSLGQKAYQGAEYFGNFPLSDIAVTVTRNGTTPAG